MSLKNYLVDIIGKDVIDRAIGEYESFKNENNEKHNQLFADHKIIAQTLIEIREELKKINKKLKL